MQVGSDAARRQCVPQVERWEAQPPPSMGARAPEAVDPGNRNQPWARGGLRQCPPKGGIAPPPWRLPALHTLALRGEGKREHRPTRGRKEYGRWRATKRPRLFPDTEIHIS